MSLVPASRIREVRLTRAERDLVASILDAHAEEFNALPFFESPALEGYTIRAGGEGYALLVDLDPILPPALVSKIAEARNRIANAPTREDDR